MTDMHENAKPMHAVRLAALALALIGASSAARADLDIYSVDNIYTEANAGRLDEAERMARDVLDNHPRSAKAHYVAAEVYAKEGKLSEAREELATAEQLAPGLPFVIPHSLAVLREALAAPGARAAPPAPPPEPGTTFSEKVVIVASVIALCIFAWSLDPTPRRRRPVARTAARCATLAPAAAVGAGVAAGAALAQEALADSDDGNDDPAPDSDLGGTDFGIVDSSSWSDTGSALTDTSSSDTGDWS